MTEASPIRRVAVRGADADALAGTGVAVVDLAAADAVLAVGEEALEAAALSGPSVPLLPVEIAGSFHGIERGQISDAATALQAGNYRLVTHPVLDIGVGGERVGRAVFDTALVTTEPARISEYSLSTDGQQLLEVRADGIVVATSFGSRGYNSAAGGPLLAPGAGLSVVPIAPFTTRADNWVVPGPLEVAVERNEGTVSLFADEEDLGEIDPHEPVRVSVGGEFDCVSPVLD
jgi:NAD+ kinase